MERLSILWALLAGFALITVLMYGFTRSFRKTAIQWAGANGRMATGTVLANLGFAFAAAAAGGYLSAWIARADPLGGALALAIVVLVMSALNALEQRGKQPAAYQVALLVISPAGVILGGLIRLWMLGVRLAGFAPG